MRLLEDCVQWICDEDDCGNKAVIEVGEGINYQSMTTHLCAECLLKAVKLLERGGGDDEL